MVLLAAVLALLVRPVNHLLRHQKKLIEQQELDDGVTIYAYENGSCSGAPRVLSSTGKRCERLSPGVYGTFSCRAMAHGTVKACRDEGCSQCVDYALLPEGHCGGALGLAGSAKFSCNSMAAKVK